MPDLLSVEAARNLVIRHARRLPGVPAHAFQSGDVLAEDIHADIDLPPFHKSLVDGYAVPMEDCGDAPARILTLLETVHAGEVPKHALQPGHCTLVMTGAPLPEGAAAVVMIEKSRTLDDGRIELSGPINPGQNRLEQGGELRSRELVFKKHTLLKPAHIGVLASIGRLTGATVQRALASVVSTGDELVPP